MHLAHVFHDWACVRLWGAWSSLYPTFPVFWNIEWHELFTGREYVGSIEGFVNGLFVWRRVPKVGALERAAVILMFNAKLEADDKLIIEASMHVTFHLVKWAPGVLALNTAFSRGNWSQVDASPATVKKVLLESTWFYSWKLLLELLSSFFFLWFPLSPTQAF